MKKLHYIILILMFCSVTNLWAGKIPEPPPIRDLEVRNYLKTLYDNGSNLEVVTTNPNGTRKGDYGDIVLYKGATQSVIEICISSPNGTIWQGISLDSI